MPRSSSFTIPVDATLYDALQLQPVKLLSLTMTAWAHWCREHFVSYPRLVREHGAGLVVASFDIEYLTPCGFFDADELDVRGVVTSHWDGGYLYGVTDIAVGGRVAARTRVSARCVLISENDSLSATPGDWPEAVRERFAPDEIVEDAPPLFVGGAGAEIAKSSSLVAERRQHFVVHRHLCEVADQWAYTEIPALVGASREALALDESSGDTRLRSTLRRPIQRISADLRRPFFAFDEGTLMTRAYCRPDNTVVFVHRIVSEIGAAAEHCVVMEQL